MLPLIVSDNVSWEDFAESTPFRDVARIISALSTQDETISEQFRALTTGKQIGGRKIIFDGKIPIGLELDLKDFADKINAKIWERVAKINWRTFQEAREFVRKINLKNVDEWRDYCMSGNKPEDIPPIPHKVYLNQGWLSFGDWLGTGTISNQGREYCTFEYARAFVRKLNLQNRSDWNIYCQSGIKPIDIPSKPERVYKDRGWLSMGDWLGTGVIASQSIHYRSFFEARKFVHSLNLKTGNEWLDYCHSGHKPDDIPTNVKKSYSGKGWSGMGDWLGTGTIAPFLRTYLSFEDAREFVRKLNLKSANEWREYCKAGNKPDNIPATPYKAYFGIGWINWADWLGKVT